MAHILLRCLLLLFKIYDIKNKFITLMINSDNKHTPNVTVNRDLRAGSVLIAPFINQLRDILIYSAAVLLFYFH